jgi:D-aminopeptidase
MVHRIKILLDQRLDPLYEATIEATEVAILNSLCMARDMEGQGGNFAPALPLDLVREFVDAHRNLVGRMSAPARPGVLPPPRLPEPVDAGPKAEVKTADALPSDARGVPLPTAREEQLPARKPGSDDKP